MEMRHILVIVWEIKKREGTEETTGAEMEEVWENRQGRAARLMW
jgi:hypothetical protein